MKTYFAYGSNMDPARMHERCPEATVIGAARLPGFTLLFHHAARSQGGGVADVRESEAGEVWGVLYAIPDGAPWLALCKCEGYQPGRADRFNTHLPLHCTVLAIDRPEEDEAGHTPVEAITFYVNPVPLPPRPTRRYKQYLIAGAIANHLPADYITRLEALPTIN